MLAVNKTTRTLGGVAVVVVRGGEGVAAVGVDEGGVAARGGEWGGGSYRSGDEECFWGSPEEFSGGGGGGGGGWPVVAGGGEVREGFVCV
nr:hypothetical protein [Tanacetum cinerariifolium]